jgi:hypothetical protein
MLKTREEIIEWLKQMHVYSYIINDDLVVDAQGHVDLSHRFNGPSYEEWVKEKIETGYEPTESGIMRKVVHGDWLELEYHGPFFHASHLPVQFGTVLGNFDISYNSFTSLIGSPKKVLGSFDCIFNNLSNMLHSPVFVGQDFDCGYNFLPHESGTVPTCTIGDLEGLPREIGGRFSSLDVFPEFSEFVDDNSHITVPSDKYNFLMNVFYERQHFNLEVSESARSGTNRKFKL